MSKWCKEVFMGFYLFIYLIINLIASGHTFDWMMPRRNRRHLDKRKRKKKDLLTFLTHNS